MKSVVETKRRNRNWFSVDMDGLAQLQAGRPKWHIARELIQNAFDENVTDVVVTIFRESTKTTRIVVEDNCPEGFKDLTDAFTLFGSTYKRSDPTKRGRFNLGEKQAIAQAKRAEIATTKGTVIFDDGGRRTSRSKRLSGSAVMLLITCKMEEHNEMIRQSKRFIAPTHVSYMINGELTSPPLPIKEFEARLLPTVLLEGGMMKDTCRNTNVRLYNPNGDGAWLFELGIPVCKIECKWDLDVQQKVPLAMDRESVRSTFLSDLYAQVLNATVADLTPEESSAAWIRLGAGHFEVKRNTTEQLVRLRWGDKVAVATPGAERENDEAVAKGYRLVHGSELSSEEWERVRDAKVMPSTKELFGLNPGNAEQVEPTDAMRRVASLARIIAGRVLGIEISVRFIDLPGSAGLAFYGERCLKFVVNMLPKDFFDDPTAAKVIDLIIHELGHEHGHHTDVGYLDALTKLGGELTHLALVEPEFFKV